MAVPIQFTNITQRDIVSGATNVANDALLVLRILPEQGLGVNVNGGEVGQKARPSLEGMLDGLDYVLPSIAELYRVDNVTNQKLGPSLLLYATLESSGFNYGKPTEAVYFDLVLRPELPLDDLTLYGLFYSTTLPGEWLPSNLLTF